MGCNHLKLEICNVSSGRVIVESFIALADLPFDRFSTRKMTMRSKYREGIELPSVYSYITAEVTFFVEQLDEAENARYSQNSLHLTLSALQRKMPDRIDIFNKDSTKD